MRLEVIPWSEFQKGIAPLWKASDPKSIPILNNPYRLIRYPWTEWRERLIYFPCRLMDGKVPVAYTSIYNLSDCVTRIRGIYVLPGHRGHGVGHRIWQEAAKLFPAGFHRTIGFWREDSAPRFIKHSNMDILPGTDWFWSDFSQVNMRLLYRDHGPRPTDLIPNQLFLQYKREEFGIGGSNNLDRSWTDAEWEEFAQPYAENYPDGHINIDF